MGKLRREKTAVIRKSSLQRQLPLDLSPVCHVFSACITIRFGTLIYCRQDKILGTFCTAELPKHQLHGPVRVDPAGANAPTLLSPQHISCLGELPEQPALAPESVCVPCLDSLQQA